MTVRIGIAGIAGRMGGALVRAVLARQDMILAAGSERPGHALIGNPVRDPSGAVETEAPVVASADDLAARCDVIIDFTAPAALAGHLQAAQAHGRAVVVGTTGLGVAERALLAEAAQHIAIVQAANMSLGVNLLAGLVGRAAAALDFDWDIEIVEMHHRDKRDAPSGTALLLGAAAAAGRGVALDEVAERGRDGLDAKRRPGAIGFASLRGGTVAGDHTVIFAGADERIELTHKAADRAIFARGAVVAARWLADKPAGLYGIADVLGLKD